MIDMPSNDAFQLTLLNALVVFFLLDQGAHNNNSVKHNEYADDEFVYVY